MFAFFSNLIAVSVPILVILIIDKVIVQHDMQSLIVLTAVLTFTVVAETGLYFLKNHLFGHFSTQVSAAFGGLLYNRLMDLPTMNFKAESIGSLVTRMQALNVVNALITDSIFIILIDTVFLILFLLTMVWINLSLTLGSFAFIAVFGAISLYFSLLAERRNNTLYESTALYQSKMVETIHGMETIRTLNIGQKIKATLQNAVAQLLAHDFERRRVTNLQDATALFMLRSSSVFVISYGAFLVIKSELTLGQLIGFNILLGMIHAPLQRVAHVFTQFSQMRVAVQRANEFFSAEPERQIDGYTAPCGDFTIAFNHVSFAYPGIHETALKDVSFLIEPGTHVAIVGESGSGKSTLAKLIGGLFDPSSGAIQYNGIPSTLIAPNSIRQVIAHASQDSILFDGTVIDNLCYGAKPNTPMESIISCAHDACINEFVDSFDQGYLAQVGERGGNLSGGQRQRVVLAREMIRDTSTLLLDEATNAIDEKNEATIYANLKRRYQGKTLIYITHSLNLIFHADLVLHVHQGQVRVEDRRESV